MNGLNFVPTGVKPKSQPIHKRYVVGKDDEGKTCVYDTEEHSFVYRTTNKNPDKVKEIIEKRYKKKNIHYVEGVMSGIEDYYLKHPNSMSVIKKREEISIVKVNKKKDLMIRTVNYIDKYKVSNGCGDMKIDFDFDKEKNILRVHLTSEELGIVKGMQMLEYDIDKPEYRYFMYGKIRQKSQLLEELFK